jgi:hypothetical protein
VRLITTMNLGPFIVRCAAVVARGGRPTERLVRFLSEACESRVRGQIKRTEQFGYCYAKRIVQSV